MQVLETPRLSSEINVAPMIDVLLVLLVVFMLSMTVGISPRGALRQPAAFLAVHQSCWNLAVRRDD